MPIYLHFAHLYFKVLIYFTNVHIHAESHIQRTSNFLNLFFLNNSQRLCSGVQEYRDIYSFIVKIVCVCVCVCLCVIKFSETTGPTDATFHVEPPWDRWINRKLIRIIYVIRCYSFLLAPRRGHLQWFYHKFGPAVQGFEHWKVKSPSNSWPRGGWGYKWLVHWRL